MARICSRDGKITEYIGKKKGPRSRGIGMLLPITSAQALGPRKKRVWNVFRRFCPASFRFFFEGRAPVSGQLWYSERKLLYELVRSYRPEVCFEIGTWRGGGSTLFISQALRDNGAGRLYTVEIDRGFYESALLQYREHLPELLPFVDFNCGDFRQIYARLLDQLGKVDFLILDGPEDGQVNLEQFQFFAPYLRPGSILVQHDWFTEKASKVKPQLQGDGWRVMTILRPPYSVGMAVLEKV